jgi:hypothetical protein
MVASSLKDIARHLTDGLLMYVKVAALPALQKDCLTIFIKSTRYHDVAYGLGLAEALQGDRSLVSV